MDEIRLLLSGSTADLARLYSHERGFHGSAVISMPADRTLTIFLISVREYKLSIVGDATLELDDYSDETMRFFDISWSEKAQKRGEGSATVLVEHPEFSDQPFIFSLTIGAVQFGRS